MKDETARERLREAWRRSGWYAPVTVGRALAQTARHAGTSELVFAPVDGMPQTVSLEQLHVSALGVAGALMRAGVGPGDVVVLQAPIDRSSTEVLEALWLLGTVIVPVGVTATAVELAHVVRESRVHDGRRTQIP